MKLNHLKGKNRSRKPSSVLKSGLKSCVRYLFVRWTNTCCLSERWTWIYQGLTGFKEQSSIRKKTRLGHLGNNKDELYLILSIPTTAIMTPWCHQESVAPYHDGAGVTVALPHRGLGRLLGPSARSSALSGRRSCWGWTRTPRQPLEWSKWWSQLDTWLLSLTWASRWDWQCRCQTIAHWQQLIQIRIT